MKRYLAVSLVTVMALAAGVSRASAHHSFAATYLEDQSVTIEGERRIMRSQANWFGRLLLNGCR